MRSTPSVLRLLGVLGVAASAALHLCGYMPAVAVGSGIMTAALSLLPGMLLMVIVLVLRVGRASRMPSRPPVARWLGLVPRGVWVLAVLVVVYVALTLVGGIMARQGGSPSATDTGYVLESRGRILREISEDEYARLTATDVRTVTALALLFYGVPTLFLLWIEPGLASPSHAALILDQFTRQAVPFATSPGIQDEEALRLVVEFSGAGAHDTVLDVACGPGIIVCAFAKVVKHATGLDLTPAMLDRARVLQKEKGLTNITWQLGEAIPLPYPDASFSIVTSRFAFHHFLDPATALQEMARVCRPGGKVVVIDSAPAPDKADAFNAMEKVRDPSHARAMPLAELKSLYARAGLPEPHTTGYRLEGELEALIKRSFPNPGDDETLRRIFRASLAGDTLGIGARADGDTIRLGYPVAVLAAEKR